MFQPNRRYRHRTFSSVSFEVLRVIEGGRSSKVAVLWFNKDRLISEIEDILVIPEWQYVNYSEVRGDEK